MRFSPCFDRPWSSKASQRLPRIPIIFRSLLNFTENSRRCSDDLWALKKTTTLTCLNFFRTQSYHSKPFSNIFLEIEWILVINHVFKWQFVWICESGVRNCPWCARLMSLHARASCKVHNQCISKVKEPWSSSVTLANAMPTSVINSTVVLIVPLICHGERVYKQNILCKTSLSIKVNSLFLHKITGLVQNLPKATITLLPRKNWTYGIFPFLSFYFHSSYDNKNQLTQVLPEL